MPQSFGAKQTPTANGALTLHELQDLLRTASKQYSAPHKAMSPSSARLLSAVLASLMHGTYAACPGCA